MAQVRKARTSGVLPWGWRTDEAGYATEGKFSGTDDCRTRQAN